MFNLITKRRISSVLFVQRLPNSLPSREFQRTFTHPGHKYINAYGTISKHTVVVPNCLWIVPNLKCSTTPGFSTRLKNFLGLGKISKSIARATGYKLYECIDMEINHEVFFKELQLEDSFHSWFIIRSLHVWMLMARLMNEGENGRLVRNALVEAMWEDVDFKSKQIGETASSIRKKQIQALVDEFQGNLFAYDEGLLSSDQVLAGAVWRNILSQKNFHPRKLEILVDYIRENVAALDKITSETIFQECKVEWVKIRF